MKILGASPGPYGGFSSSQWGGRRRLSRAAAILALWLPTAKGLERKGLAAVAGIITLDPAPEDSMAMSSGSPSSLRFLNRPNAFACHAADFVRILTVPTRGRLRRPMAPGNSVWRTTCSLNSTADTLPKGALWLY